jgi:MoaA/NifB/PqqE/SkfB family radical SAM enzyme
VDRARPTEETGSTRLVREGKIVQAETRSDPGAATERFALAKVLAANPHMLRVKPGAALFLARYMRRFRVKRAGRDLILHSHLPPLTSAAYSRFVAEHLVARVPGPSHAQVGLTNACPQDCEYCYNKQRDGEPMDTDTILGVIDDLKKMGVVWLGFTGGEPLLNPHIVEITAHAAGDCAVKLFTTGCGLTPRLARELAEAGMFSVAVSLDHWEAKRHDAARRYAGAFETALDAIAMFKAVPGLHVSVSAVVSREMIHSGDVTRLLAFLESLAVDEAWLSEVKPSIEPLWRDDLVITEEERLWLAALQDSYNRRGGMTVNYLGHFEGAETFGCNAGCKMVYVDAFGDVSPCVFLPMVYGNVREQALDDLVGDMRASFPGEARCFINRNFGLFRETGGELPLDRERSRALLGDVAFGRPSAFNERLSGGPGRP